MTALRWRPSPHVLLLLLLSLVVIAPLAQPGYFWGAHDARHDVYFIFQYDRSVLEGDWMPRWGPDWAFGYGYPFWIIYAPLGVIAGEAFHHFLGFGWEASVKAVLALSIVGSGLAMYGFVRSWLGRNAALVAGVAYMAIPYHLVDVYVRAALPESVALALLPLALWAFRSLSLRPTLAGILGAAIAYSALWWTHNLTAAIFTPLLGLYILALLWWRAGDEDQPAAPAKGRLVRIVRTAVAPLAAGLLGLGLSAAFLLPAILETRYINQSQWFGAYYNPFQHFVYFFQLFQPTWGYGISLPGPVESEQGSLSYQLGAAIVVLALVSLAGISRRDRTQRRELRLLAGWAVLAVFLTLGLSALAWRYIPLVPYAQFPWRYLLLAIVPLSVLAGSVVAESSECADGPPSRSLGWAPPLLAAIVLLGSFPYLRAEMRVPTPEQGPVSYAALMRFQRTSNEMTGVTAWVDPAAIPTWSSMADIWLQGGEVETRVDYSQVPQNSRLAVNAEEGGPEHETIWYTAEGPEQTIRFNRFWYPGWRAYLVDGVGGRILSELPVVREDGPLARVEVRVPGGTGYVLLRFEDTPLRTAAKYITWGAIAVAIVLLAAPLWRRRGSVAPGRAE